MPCNLPHSHKKIVITKYTMYSSSQPHNLSPQYKPYIPPHSHSILLTTKCVIFFLTVTPQISSQCMPCILPHSHPTILTSKYAMYSSSQSLHTLHRKIRHIFFLSLSTLFITNTPRISVALHSLTHNMPCILPHSYTISSPQNMP
jgi:hypothetical protein